MFLCTAQNVSDIGLCCVPQRPLASCSSIDLVAAYFDDVHGGGRRLAVRCNTLEWAHLRSHSPRSLFAITWPGDGASISEWLLIAAKLSDSERVRPAARNQMGAGGSDGGGVVDCRSGSGDRDGGDGDGLAAGLADELFADDAADMYDERMASDAVEIGADIVERRQVQCQSC